MLIPQLNGTFEDVQVVHIMQTPSGTPIIDLVSRMVAEDPWKISETGMLVADFLNQLPVSSK